MRRTRTEVRMLCADLVEVCWRDSSGRRYRTTGLLEDISTSGMCMQFEVPVALETRLEIHCPGERLTGTVRYCVYREIGYFVGIELDNTCHWSRDQFEPQHLLDLEELMRRTVHRAQTRVKPN
jgi:hypothetical protein